MSSNDTNIKSTNKSSKSTGKGRASGHKAEGWTPLSAHSKREREHNEWAQLQNLRRLG